MKNLLLGPLGASLFAMVACSNDLSDQTATSSTAELNSAELANLQDASVNDDADTPVIVVNDDEPYEAITSEAADASEPIEPNGQVESFPWRPADGEQLSFKVLRKGNDFGTHSISFSGDPDGELTVTSEVSLRAGLGPITAFRYTLEAQETWQDGVLVALSGKTNDNGDKLEVSAEKQGDALNISGTAYSGFAELGLLPSSHWHKGQVSASQILSTEDGELLDVSSELIGQETIKAAGRDIQADRYLLKSDIDLDLWYDTENRLVKLAFEARGQNIEYVLTGASNS